jgi:hypothetical protein
LTTHTEEVKADKAGELADRKLAMVKLLVDEKLELQRNTQTILWLHAAKLERRDKFKIFNKKHPFGQAISIRPARNAKA